MDHTDFYLHTIGHNIRINPYNPLPIIINIINQIKKEMNNKRVKILGNVKYNAYFCTRKSKNIN